MDDEQRQKFYRVMHDDTDRLTSTVEQVLRAAETVQKRGERNWSKIDLAALLHECVQVARVRHHLTEDNMAEANHSQDAGESTVLGDAEELRSAIANILDNSVKYSTDGVKVKAEVVPVGADVVVRVKDHGVGIPAPDLKRIFKRFYRAGRARTKVKGTGLGLFIVREIVKKHGGSVEAESEGEGKGATVTLRLPRLEEK
jgi:two-component system sensor histidine kinase SenX3